MSDRPHVLHVITTLNVGGAERMLVKLVRGLEDRFQFTVVCLLPEGPLAEPLREAGVDVVSLNMKSPMAVPGAVRKLMAVVRERQPDVIQTWLYHADFLGTLAALWLRMRNKLVWNLRCSDIDFKQHAASTRIVVLALGRLSRSVRMIITNAEAGRRQHLAIGYQPQHWRIIPNGFDVSSFRPDAASRARIRQSLDVPNDVPVIGLVQRYDPQKDFETFLQAALSVGEHHGDLHFVLAGAGVDTGNSAIVNHPAVQAYGDRFRLIGVRRDVTAVMASFDVFVLPSAYGEGFPNVLGEAMACGVPCISTDVGDARKIIGDTGLIVSPKSPDRLASAINSLLAESVEERTARGKRARQRVENHYALPDVLEQYSEVYRETADPIDNALGASQ